VKFEDFEADAMGMTEIVRSSYLYLFFLYPFLPPTYFSISPCASAKPGIQLEENILSIYAKLYHKYESDKKFIPEGNLIEVKFEA